MQRKKENLGNMWAYVGQKKMQNKMWKEKRMWEKQKMWEKIENVRK